ncbi:hypothetical protein [Terrarubrum flagellatum]|uniref:hypothetical protein n=1 Tax=Terrirubrum flagellatum TaxID=2895980 RepID=UPI003144DE64
MARAKGALSAEQMNLGWPHRCEVPVCRTDFSAWCRLHRELIDAARPDGRSIMSGYDDAETLIYCFPTPEAADAFHTRFGGERHEIVAEYRVDALGWPTGRLKGFRRVARP